MPAQTPLLVAIGVILLLMVLARLALDGQIRAARARADEQERAWRARQSGEATDAREPRT